MILPLLAVHISDGVLSVPWLGGGFALAACLLAWSSRNVSEEEIPRIGLLTAAFFVASQIRVPLGPSSVHLLLAGLVGIILGRRAVLAVAVGLFLQALLFGHGGFSTLGVNTCVMSIPALAAQPLFSWFTRPSYPSFRWGNGFTAAAYILSPILAAIVFVFDLVLIRTKWLTGGDALFRAGFLVGWLSVMLTALLNAGVLVLGGVSDWRILASVVVAAHVPIAFIEGLVVGCTVSFLRRVKPEMLRQSARILQPRFNRKEVCHDPQT
jgi:cobalt/nickel transport system permease protein